MNVPTGHLILAHGLRVECPEFVPLAVPCHVTEESDRQAATQVLEQVHSCRRLGSLTDSGISFRKPNAPSQPDAKNSKACEDNAAYRDRPTKRIAGQGAVDAEDAEDAEEQRGSGHHAA